MTVNLTWTPGSGATQQTIQYRAQGTTNWTTYPPVINNNTTSSATLTLPDGAYEFRILNNCPSCTCPNGSTLSGQNCLTVETISATQTGTPIQLARTPFSVYGNSGTIVHNDLNPAGTFTRLDISNPFWLRQPIADFGNLTPAQRQAADLNNGPVNRLAIWGFQDDGTGTALNNYTVGNGTLTPLDTWIGFDVCINIQSTKTYYVAIAADNYYRFSLDGVLVLADLRQNTEVFNYLHIYAVTITAGSHILRLEGLNTGGFAGFGCEIFDLDNRGSLSVVDFLNQQTNYNNLNVVFTTRNMTQFTSNIFTCPTGYDQINPSCNQVLCTRTTSTPCTPQVTYSNVTSGSGTCPAPSVTTVTLTPQQSIPHP